MQNNDTLIVIPSRYASTRLPGKPLLKILGKEMVLRVYENAMLVKNKLKNVDVVVATDDERIVNFCIENNINVLLVNTPCRSGTERVINTLLSIDKKYKYVVNLQGDNPLCPPRFVEEIILALKAQSDASVVTPCVNLTWTELDKLREYKKQTPFSGTTVVFDKDKRALWFSKQIIPAIRKEEKLREEGKFSPVFRHIGLYGFNVECLLTKIRNLKETKYEALEGLEQLSWLENNIRVNVICVSYQNRSEMSGIDTKEDLLRAEQIIKNEGDFSKDY